MKTITYNPETHVLVPREPSEEMIRSAAFHYSSDEYTGFISTYKAALSAAPQPDLTEKRQYYFKNSNCKASSAHDPDCICWHDEGTGPMLPCIDGEYLVKMTWRNIAPQPEPVESEPVAYYSAHYKTPTGTKEFHGLAENPLPAGTKLYPTPQPDRTAELEAETTKLKLDLLTSYGEAEELSGKVAELEAALKMAREIAINAATSLETIAIRSYGEDSYLDSKPQMRAFAQARASVAMKELTRINEVIGE